MSLCEETGNAYLDQFFQLHATIFLNVTKMCVCVCMGQFKQFTVFTNYNEHQHPKLVPFCYYWTYS